MGIAWKMNGLENRVSRFARDKNYQKNQNGAKVERNYLFLPKTGFYPKCVLSVDLSLKVSFTAKFLMLPVIS